MIFNILKYVSKDFGGKFKTVNGLNKNVKVLVLNYSQCIMYIHISLKK